MNKKFDLENFVAYLKEIHERKQQIKQIHEQQPIQPIIQQWSSGKMIRSKKINNFPQQPKAQYILDFQPNAKYTKEFINLRKNDRKYFKLNDRLNCTNHKKNNSYHVSTTCQTHLKLSQDWTKQMLDELIQYSPNKQNKYDYNNFRNKTYDQIVDEINQRKIQKYQKISKNNDYHKNVHELFFLKQKPSMQYDQQKNNTNLSNSNNMSLTFN